MRDSEANDHPQAELEQAYAELERHREQLVEAQRLAGLGSWEWDPSSGAVSWSEELYRILGYEPGALEPSHDDFVRLIHPDDRERRREAIERGLRSEEPFAYEARIVRPDGDVRHLHVRARAELGPDGEPVRLVGTAQDVSAARRADDERRLLEARWQEAQRLESLGVLAGGIAHDFNNLLVGVLGNASLALAELPPHSPVRARIEEVELAARRAGELTRQMLAYAGQGSFSVRPLDLVDVLEETRALLETVVSEGVRLELVPGAERPVVEADAPQLRQVLLNLVVNASEACSEGGRITVGTSLTTAGAGDDLAPGTYALLEVADTGSGMDAETRTRIFDPFFTSKFAGRGLGLAGVLGIVRAHGGAIRVESEPGRGSTFGVLLPLAATTAPEQPSASAPPAEPRAATILVADDERVIREVAGAMLENAGFTVVAACDGDEALAVFAERSDEIDAVVLDLTMPGRGGEEVLRELRGLRRDLPVVISSGYSAHALDGSRDAVGEIAFVQKPYTAAELVGTVRAALER